MISLYWLFAFCAAGYLVGNLNPAHAIARFLKKDIKKLGSGNPGTMNVLRQFGVKWGGICLLLDVLKGAIPAMIAFFCFGGAVFITDNLNTLDSYIALYATGLAVIVGHCFPIFRKFKGGKGFASMIGVLTVAHPWVSFIAFWVMMLYIAAFEYGAMGSFLYLTFMVSYAALQPFNEYNIAVCAMLFAFYFLMFYTHRTNIARLMTGKENSVTYLKSFHRKRLKKKQEKWLADMGLSDKKL